MDLLALYAQATPAKTALIDDHDGNGQQLSYAELDIEANRVANVLVDHGVGAGDKVAWCGQNSVGVVVLLCAAQRLGATAVPVNYRFTDSEAAYVIDHSDATVVYVDAELAPMLARIRDEPTVRAVRTRLRWALSRVHRRLVRFRRRPDSRRAAYHATARSKALGMGRR